MKDFKWAEEKLGGRESRKLAHRTYLQRRGEEKIVLKYINTDVVEYLKDGRVVLDTHGWKTTTTKMRLNDWSPLRLWSEKGVWYVNDPDGGVATFEDGLTVHADGTLTGVGEDPKKIQRLRKKVADYSRDYIKAMREGKVGRPSGGDCLFCQFGLQKKENEPGQDKDHLYLASHLLSHIKEGYYVPSLLAAAMKVGTSQAEKWAVGEVWGAVGEDGKVVMDRIQPGWSQEEFVWKGVEKALRKFVFKGLGMVR